MPGRIAMPIYEYQCDKCHRRTSVLTTRVSERVEPVCKHCGSRALSRLMSRFATPRSEEARMDSLADPAKFSGLDADDPKSAAKVMRRLGREMGDEFGESEFDEAIEELESGKLGPEDGGGPDDSGDDL